MRLTFLSPYSQSQAPSARQMLIAATPWALIALFGLYALTS